MNFADLIVSNLFSIVSSVVAAVAGYLVLRGIRHLRGDTQATADRAANAENAAGNAAADASTTKGEVETLTDIVRKQAAAIEDMAHRYDNVWAKFLTNESLDMRLKRVEKYLAEHELDRKQAEILGAFSGPITLPEGTNS